MHFEYMVCKSICMIVPSLHYSRFLRMRNHLFELRPQKVSYLKGPFHNQGQSFLYSGTITSNQVKSRYVKAPCMYVYWTLLIAVYNIYCTVEFSNTNTMLYAFKINTSLQSTGNIFDVLKTLNDSTKQKCSGYVKMLLNDSNITKQKFNL